MLDVKVGNKTMPNPNPPTVEKDRIPHTILETSGKTSFPASDPKCFTYRRPTILHEHTTNSRPTNCPNLKPLLLSTTNKRIPTKLYTVSHRIVPDRSDPLGSVGKKKMIAPVGSQGVQQKDTEPQTTYGQTKPHFSYHTWNK